MSITDALSALIAPRIRSRSSRGWINIDCPACGDTRGRGGFIPTPEGGFRYSCFNGGCEFNGTPTGWEPGGGFGGRPRKLFEMLGGDIRDIPLEDIMRMSKDRFRGSSGASPTLSFEECPLPEHCVPIHDPGIHVDDPKYLKAAEFIMGKPPGVLERGSFYWTPLHKNYIILAFHHYDKIVGWMGRATNEAIEQRFIGKSPPNYVFNQDKLERVSGKVAVVVEGPYDALALGNAFATRNSKITDTQQALFEMSGRRIIVLPEQNKTGLSYIDTAEKMGWEISIPHWDSGVKDPVNAAARYGSLYTLESVVSGAGRNYAGARFRIEVRG